MSANLAALAYLIAGVLFILALRELRIDTSGAAICSA
jgi:NAD/NADP transhydrogenase beta subunit